MKAARYASTKRAVADRFSKSKRLNPQPQQRPIRHVACLCKGALGWHQRLSVTSCILLMALFRENVRDVAIRLQVCLPLYTDCAWRSWCC